MAEEEKGEESLDLWHHLEVESLDPDLLMMKRSTARDSSTEVWIIGR